MFLFLRRVFKDSEILNLYSFFIEREKGSRRFG